MSIYFNYFLFGTLVFGLLTILRHRLQSGVLWVFFVAWVVPIQLSQFSDLPLNRTWEMITVIATSSALFGLYIGYYTGLLIPLKLIGQQSQNLNYGILSKVILLLQSVVLLAFTYLFIKLGRPPLLSGNVLENRKLIQELNPLLWSVVQLSFMTSTLSSVLSINGFWDKLNKFLFFIIFICIALTGWRNFILLYLGYFFLPILFKKKINLGRLFLVLLLLILGFVFIGYLRGDLGDEFNSANALGIIALYVYPGFLNFETLAVEGDSSSHLYTLQFFLKPVLDFFNFNTSPPQTNIDAFNVATALNPLYQDGGVFNIFLTTFLIGFFLQRLESNRINGILPTFWRSTLILTVVFFHNGWLLLNFMPTYNTLVFLIAYCFFYSIYKQLKIGVL